MSRERLEKLRRLKELRAKKNMRPSEGPNVSELESLQAGLAQGGTLGFGEELMGGIKAAQDIMGDKFSLSDLPERYQQRRDEYRAYNELARAQNPKSYMTGEIGGGVGTSFVPGMGAATLGKTIGLGAVAGLGTSNADLTEGELLSAAGDVALGGGAGALGYGVAKGVGTLASKMRPKNLAKSYLGLPEPAYDQLVKNPEAVKAALAKNQEMYGLPEISQRLSSRVDDLAEQAVTGSRAARGIVEQEGTRLPKEQLYAKLQQRLDDIARSEGRIPDEGFARAKQVLQSQQEKIKDLPDLTGPEIMDRVREMRKATEFSKEFGNIDSKSAAIIKQAARDYDQMLKGASPAYTDAMKDAAQAAQLLERAKPLARSEQGALNFVGSVDKAGNKFRTEVLKELDKRFGDTLSEDAMNAIAARVIDRSSAQGSQRVNLFAKIGEAIGSLFPGERLGKVMGAAGAAAGAGVDAYGRKLAIPMVDLAAKIDRAVQSNRFSAGVQKLLKDAAARGPQNLVLTFQLLSRDNPELQRSLGD